MPNAVVNVFRSAISLLLSMGAGCHANAAQQLSRRFSPHAVLFTKPFAAAVTDPDGAALRKPHASGTGPSLAFVTVHSAFLLDIGYSTGAGSIEQDEDLYQCDRHSLWIDSTGSPSGTCARWWCWRSVCTSAGRRRSSP